MTKFNREDPRTVLPQIEKTLNEIIESIDAKIERARSYEEIATTAHLCSKGSANVCYKMGNIVFLFFNINISTSSIATAYLKDLPKPIHNCACCSNSARFRLDTSGELVSEEAPSTGWHNGSIVYISE